MKKSFLWIASFLFIILSSCSKDKGANRDEIVKNNVEEYIKAKLNDPESYKFVSLKLVDSTLYSDNIKFRQESFLNEIKSDKEDLDRQEDYRKSIPSMYEQQHVKELKTKIAQNKKILSEIERLEKSLGQKVNEVASYKYLFSCRAKNALGAKVLNEYIVQTDPLPAYKVINMTDDKDKVYLNPNEFPGYQEMITKYLGR